MIPLYVDIHIHTSHDPNNLNTAYDLDLLVKKIQEFNGGGEFLISLTDHNVINKHAYLEAVKKDINIILGVELHIKNYNDCPAYHCHIFFDLDAITSEIIDDLNKKLDNLYPQKVVEKSDPSIPKIQDIINEFDSYEFMLLPHGGQSHATFDTSIPSGVKFDTTLERSIYYNQFDGFTARGDTKLEKTQEYFKRLGINEFVNLVTCSDNYNPNIYPNGKDKNPFKPTWILAKPTFNGLRLSLSEDSRLVYSADKPKFWSEFIKSVKHQRDNIDIDVNLTPGLNVVIGSSSSGKSLLVDSIVRILSNQETNEKYERYEAHKIQIENPSGMVPHYLSQNYIAILVNKVSSDDIEDIDIIKRAFPGDDDIRDSINNGLNSFKRNIQDLIKSVEIIEEESAALTKIPKLSRLITKENVAGNIFENLHPSDLEIEKLTFTQGRHEELTGYLDEVDEFLSNYPFVTNDNEAIENLKDKLNSSLRISRLEKQIRTIISSEKDSYDVLLRTMDSEDQTKKQSFQKLLGSLKRYVQAYYQFHNTIQTISSYSITSDSEEIESMGHKLFIQNDFELNKEKFLSTVNHFLVNKIPNFESIRPDFFFQSNFQKQSPNVRDYDDFGKRIFGKFETLNKKNYKIITTQGAQFENLSPGWKTSVLLDIILGYDDDISPIIIDQPEDNLATTYINEGLVTAIKKIKSKKQIILVSHNATIPMLADAQNVVFCQNRDNKLVIKSSPLEGSIDGKWVVDHIAEITDGGKPSIKKRVKKYNLKKFT